MDRTSFVEFTAQTVSAKLRHSPREFRWMPRKSRRARQAQQRQGDRVVAGKNHEVLGTALASAAICEIFPEASLMPTIFSIAASGLRSLAQDSRRSGRHVIKNDRQPRAARGWLDSAGITLLSGLVVIRRHRKQAICAQGFQFPRQFDHLLGVYPPAPASTGIFAVRFLQCDFDDSQMFLRVSVGLSRGATRNQKVHAAANLPLH